MRPTFVILKKELKRIFTDRRVLISIFLPGILIFVLYSVLGNFMKDAVSSQTFENTAYKIAYSDNNVPETQKPYVIIAFESYLEQTQSEKTNYAQLHVVSALTVEENKKAVEEGKYDVYIQFSDNFDQNVLNKSYAEEKEHIDLYYNGAKDSASHAYKILVSAVDSTYKNYLVNIDGQSKPINPNVSQKDADTARVLAMLIPMLTLLITFSTVLTLTPDTVAGEKERGTLGAMLLAPINRGSIVVAKLISTLTVATLGGIFNFAGLFGGLNFMGLNLGGTMTPLMVLVLALLIITATIMFVTIGLLISTLSKSAKEASNYMIPFMVLTMLAAILTNTMSSAGMAMACVPFFNIAICVNLLVTSATIPIEFTLLTVLVNVALSVLICFAIAKLFKKESIMVK